MSNPILQGESSESMINFLFDEENAGVPQKRDIVCAPRYQKKNNNRSFPEE